MNVTPRFCQAALIACFATALTGFAADWKVTKGKHPDLPGQSVSVTQDGKLVARFVYGEGQHLPYLALYDEAGQLLTNAGMDKEGKAVGIEPHHRGIFIGWQQIKSDLGTSGLWGLGSTGKSKSGEPATMRVVEVQQNSAAKDSATIVARIEWRAGTKDATGENLLLTETRTLRISRPERGVAAQVDAAFRLRPARDLSLGGDVQHAGIHLRVSHGVVARADDTSYLWSPPTAPTAGKGYSKTAKGQSGSVVSKDLQWGEFLFPLHERWYSALQLNSPQNPVEEFSTREYGRFGFFFKRDLKKGEPLELKYRFLVRETTAPQTAPTRSDAQLREARKQADAAYSAFVREVP